MLAMDLLAALEHTADTATTRTVLAALRETDRTTPVILITAFGDDATHREARELGADAMFDKPFDLEDLRTAAYYFAPPR